MANLRFIKGNLFLLSAAFCWGVTFIAQKTAMDSMGPFTFTGIRFLLGTLCLIPFLLFYQRKQKNKNDENKLVRGSFFPSLSLRHVKRWLLPGFVLGVMMFWGINFQQFGLQFTTPTHSSLLTATYVFFVPIILFFLFKKKIPKHIWGIGVLIFIGIYFLTINPNQKRLFLSQEINQILVGDGLNLLGAIFWAFHIIWLEKYLNRGDAVIHLVVGQSFWVGIFSLGLAVIWEEPNVMMIVDHQLEFLIGGIFSIALGFSFQVIGQKLVPSEIAAIVLCTESLFASISDYFFLERVLNSTAYVGGALILISIVLIQIFSQQKTF